MKTENNLPVLKMPSGFADMSLSDMEHGGGKLDRKTFGWILIGGGIVLGISSLIAGTAIAFESDYWVWGLVLGTSGTVAGLALIAYGCTFHGL